MKRQYTIRDVPASVDAALRRKARAEGMSLNAVALEVLEKGLGLEAEPVFEDLDHLAGSWQEDPAFDRAVAEFEKIDEEMWK